MCVYTVKKPRVGFVSCGRFRYQAFYSLFNFIGLVLVLLNHHSLRFFWQGKIFSDSFFLFFFSVPSPNLHFFSFTFLRLIVLWCLIHSHFPGHISSSSSHSPIFSFSNTFFTFSFPDLQHGYSFFLNFTFFIPTFMRHPSSSSFNIRRRYSNCT